MTSRLTDRISDLERRLMLLEARVRRTSVELESKKAGKPVRAERPRPRCPGCLLELPKGRRGETCVWCGFVFDAVAPHPVRKRSSSAKGR